MSALISAPAQNEFLDPHSVAPESAKARPTTSWVTFFSNAYQLLDALSSSGTTAQRPTKFLFAGRTYFDTTLGKPIWILSVAAGVGTWVDAAGVVV